MFSGSLHLDAESGSVECSNSQKTTSDSESRTTQDSEGGKSAQRKRKQEDEGMFTIVNIFHVCVLCVCIVTCCMSQSINVFSLVPTSF